MEFSAPLNISIQEDESSLKRELHLTFNPAFIEEKLFERTEAFQKYIDHLNHDLHKLSSDDPDRLGIETILQTCENLAEAIAKDELDLHKTIVIEINPSTDITRLVTDPF